MKTKQDILSVCKQAIENAWVEATKFNGKDETDDFNIMRYLVYLSEIDPDIMQEVALPKNQKKGVIFPYLIDPDSKDIRWTTLEFKITDIMNFEELVEMWERAKD
ncbi:MAG: hypothetical protein AB7U45_13780 [Desulfamplus sp.]